MPPCQWPFAISIHVYMCVCACACMWGHLPYHQMPPDTLHPPVPSPEPQGNPNQKNSINLELIEIIRFCLKIWDPWTLLHTYRLGLMCRWGCPIPNGTSMFWIHLFCSRDPTIKNFPVFALDPIRPYLDWALRGFLTSQPIYNPFKFDLK